MVVLLLNRISILTIVLNAENQLSKKTVYRGEMKLMKSEEYFTYILGMSLGMLMGRYLLKNGLEILAVVTVGFGILIYKSIKER
jgi:hypothetical protein